MSVNTPEFQELEMKVIETSGTIEEALKMIKDTLAQFNDRNIFAGELDYIYKYIENKKEKIKDLVRELKIQNEDFKLLTDYLLEQKKRDKVAINGLMLHERDSEKYRSLDPMGQELIDQKIPHYNTLGLKFRNEKAKMDAQLLDLYIQIQNIYSSAK